MYTFIIEGNPVAWCAHGGFGKHSFNKRFGEKKFFQYLLKRQFDGDAPIQAAVKVEYIFQMEIPSSAPKNKQRKMENHEIKHISRPDCSNMVKFTEDALKGIVIKDDSQVVEFIARKEYDRVPKTIIKVIPI